jgi:hypothetical protein
MRTEVLWSNRPMSGGSRSRCALTLFEAATAL